jgi:hypothetical protein
MSELRHKCDKVIKELQSKEENLKNLTEKYLKYKKDLEKLQSSHEHSKVNSKYEVVVKLEMDIKIATKTVNEIKFSLISVVDDYKDSRNKFTKKSLVFYMELIKLLERQYESCRGLLMSYFDSLGDLLSLKNLNDSEITHSNIYFSDDIDLENCFTCLQKSNESGNNVKSILDTINEYKRQYETSTADILAYYEILLVYENFGNVISKFYCDAVPLLKQHKKLDCKDLEAKDTFIDYGELIQIIAISLNEVNRRLEILKEDNSAMNKITHLVKMTKEKFEDLKHKFEVFNTDLTSKHAKSLDPRKFTEFLKDELLHFHSNIKNYELLYNELNKLLLERLNSYESIFKFSYSNIYKDSNGIHKRLVENLAETILNKGSKEFKDIVHNINLFETDLEKSKTLINQEVTDFISYRKDLVKYFNITHERKCLMFNQKESIHIGSPTNYFNKIKDYINKKFRKTNNLNDLFDNIDKILSEDNVTFTSEKLYENFTLSSNIYAKKEEALWFNTLLQTWFNRWKDSDIFHKAFKRYLYRIYNKKRPDNLDTIYIDEVKLRGSPPHIKIVKEIQFDKKTDFEFLYDIDISYRGTLEVTISTDLLVKLPYIGKTVKVPIKCNLVFESVNGTIRLYYNGNEGGESWYNR